MHCECGQAENHSENEKQTQLAQYHGVWRVVPSQLWQGEDRCHAWTGLVILRQGEQLDVAVARV